MAMEDALALAEALQASPGGVEGALDAYARRRWPRVDVVRQGSRAVGEMLRLAPGVRAAVLRERGKQAFRERLSPLTERP